MSNTKIQPQVVTREVLKSQVQQAMEDARVKPGTLFIAGITKAKEHNGQHQMMLEIAQKKNLREGKANVLAIANIGDDRFNSNNRVVRVWLKVTVKGFDALFSSTGLTGAELHEGSKELAKEQVLQTFARINSIMVEGEEVNPTISVKQYSAEGNLPLRIARILDVLPEERSEQQDAELDGYTMRTNDGDFLVDSYGNQIYEVMELTYGEEENIILQKQTLKDFQAAKARRNTGHVTENVKKEEGSLIGNLVS